MRYRFADCELDTGTCVLTCQGDVRHVEPQVFDLIRLLVAARGDLVSRDAIVEAVWGGRIVSEATISSRINAARRAVGDTGAAQAIIRTVPRRGLRLAARVTEATAESTATGSDAPGRPRVRIATSTDGATIAWCADGTGPPLVRAAHWLSHLEMDLASPVWRPLLDRLGAGRRLIRYDQRGTGMSGRSVRDFSTDLLCGDLATVIEVAGAAPADIFACSQSAAPSLLLAATRPELVRSIVVYGGFALGALRRDAVSEDLARGMLEMTRRGWGQAGSAFMKSVAAIFMPDATDAQLADFVAIQLASADPDTAVLLRRAIGEMDVLDVLAEVRCPTLVIHAEHDSLHPACEGLRIAAAVPGAEFVSLPGHNHVPLPQTPGFAMLMDAVDRFLGRS